MEHEKEGVSDGFCLNSLASRVERVDKPRDQRAKEVDEDRACQTREYGNVKRDRLKWNGHHKSAEHRVVVAPLFFVEDHQNYRDQKEQQEEIAHRELAQVVMSSEAQENGQDEVVIYWGDK